MHSIVVATDFSEVANNAVHFACQMAADYKVTVTVFHSYIIPVTFGDNPMPAMPIDDSRKIAEDSMEQLLVVLKGTYPGLDINQHITYGDITDSLEEYCEKQQPWLIIIGNSAEDQSTLWFGSNVVTTMKELPYKIMAVPATARYERPKKICMACDFKDISDKFPGKELADLASAAGAELHILNIDHNNKHFGTDTPLDAEVLHEMIKSAKPTYHYMDQENTNEGIQAFVTENRIDWLVIVPHKYGFLEGLFHRSHTSAMVKMSHIPLIALHEKEA